ncbi:MAG TPA: adenylate/guanylate cyclase domain-containing protein [Gaiella sp.]|nr:adenylate/guanylate cyclase domain-containing protein [Gaiella sp.]
MLASIVLLALPLAGLVLLLVEPDADAHLLHRPTHFWLILLTALVNVVLGLAASEAARRRDDARATLVSLAFLSSAGFLALHALATPGQLLEGPNTGFDIATPVGLLIGAGFAAASALELSPPHAAAVLRHGRLLRGGLLTLLVLWAAVSLAEIPPLDQPVAPEDHRAELIAVAIAGCALYGFATIRYLGLYRRRHDLLPAATAAAWVLLAEALVAIALARSWHISWWEWHLMMTAAFALVLWAAYVGYRRSASVTAAFGGVYLDATLERVDERTADALRAILAALAEDRPVEPVLDELRAHGFTADEAAVLESSARELRRVDGLFRPYVSPALAEDLEREPQLAELGGTEREVTVLFADLEGFTQFSEHRAPAEAISMLNAYWAAAVPDLLAEGATIERFAGDAVMAVFNAVGDQPDHAERGTRAAKDLLESSARIADEHPGWPRFRAGLATGTAAVGHVGTAEQRSFAAIGDTTNLAARLQALARPGQAVLAGSTARRLSSMPLEPLGTVQVRGRSDPVEIFALGA